MYIVHVPTIEHAIQYVYNIHVARKFGTALHLPNFHTRYIIMW